MARRKVCQKGDVSAKASSHGARATFSLAPCALCFTPRVQTSKGSKDGVYSSTVGTTRIMQRRCFHLFFDESDDAKDLIT